MTTTPTVTVRAHVYRGGPPGFRRWFAGYRVFEDGRLRRCRALGGLGYVTWNAARAAAIGAARVEAVAYGSAMTAAAHAFPVDVPLPRPVAR